MIGKRKKNLFIRERYLNSYAHFNIIEFRDQIVKGQLNLMVSVVCFEKTNMNNDKGQRLSIRCCSKPDTIVAYIYDALQMKYTPFIRKKTVVLKIESETSRNFDLQTDTS